MFFLFLFFEYSIFFGKFASCYVPNIDLSTKDIENLMLWGTYKSNRMYAMSQKTSNPLVFGLLYNNITENERDAFMDKPIFYKDKKLIDYKIHDLLNVHQLSICDNEKELNFDIKSVKKYEDLNGEMKHQWFNEINVINNSTSEKSIFFYFAAENQISNQDDRFFEIVQNTNELTLIKIHEKDEKIGLFTINTEKMNRTVRTFKVPPKIAYQIPQFLYDNLNQKSIFSGKENFQKNSNLVFVQFIISPKTNCNFIVSYDSEFKEQVNVLNREEFLTLFEEKKKSFKRKLQKVFVKANFENEKMVVSLFSKFMSSVSFTYGSSLNSKLVDPFHAQEKKTGVLYFDEYFEKPKTFSFSFGSYHICRWDLFLCKYFFENLFDSINYDGFITSDYIKGNELHDYYQKKILLSQNFLEKQPALHLELGLEVLLNGILDLLDQKTPKKENFSKVKELFDFLKNTVSIKFQLYVKFMLKNFNKNLRTSCHFGWKDIRKKYKVIKESIYTSFDSGFDDFPRGLEKPLDSYRNLDLTVWLSSSTSFLSYLSFHLGNIATKKELHSLHSGCLLKNFPSSFQPSPNFFPSDITSSQMFYYHELPVFSSNIGYPTLLPFIFGLIPSPLPPSSPPFFHPPSSPTPTPDPSINTDTNFNSNTNINPSSEPKLIIDPKINPTLKNKNILVRYLELMMDEERIGSKFGIRSLDRKDKCYGMGRWRGDIWISGNFWILKGIKKFYWDWKDGMRVEEEIRKRLVENVERRWREEGVVRERYDGENGEGRGEVSDVEGLLFVSILNDDY